MEMEISRGDLVTVAVAGDYGKPRPALVIQSDAFAELESLTVLRVTSDLRDWPLFRVDIEPTSVTGLREPSHIMIDKTISVPRTRIGQRIGCIDPGTLRRVDRALAQFLGLQP